MKTVALLEKFPDIVVAMESIVYKEEEHISQIKIKAKLVDATT